MSAGLDKGRRVFTPLVILKVLCNASSWDLMCGHLGFILTTGCLHSLLSLIAFPRKAKTTSLSHTLLKACASMHVLILLAHSEMPLPPRAFCQECAPGSTSYHRPSLVPLSYSILIFLHASPRVCSPCEKGMWPFLTFSLTQCLVQRTHSLDRQVR